MFNFETWTIINSLTDPAIVDGKRFYVAGEAGKKHLRIARHFDFAEDGIVKVRRRHYEGAKNFKVDIDLTNLSVDLPQSPTVEAAGLGRIALFVNLRGATDPVFADAYGRYGKPFYIEFPIPSSVVKGGVVTKPAELAKIIVRIANKFNNLTYGSTVLKASVGDQAGHVVISGTDEYQHVAAVRVERYDPLLHSFDCCASFGGYMPMEQGITVEQGQPSFGSYRQLTADIMLPTRAHTDWANPFTDEYPVVGGKYNEYTIIYRQERPGLGGMSAVGQEVYSTTMHTFFVESAVVEEFEKALSQVAAIDDILKDYDDVVAFAGKDTRRELADSYNDKEKIKEIQDKVQGKNKEDKEGAKSDAGAALAEPEGLTDGIRTPNTGA